MRFHPAKLGLFIAMGLTLAGETAFRPHAILFPQPPHDQAARNKLLQAILVEGWKLTPAKAAQLEAKLVQNPENLPVRLKLISYYCQHALSEPRVRHVLELIASHPDSDVFQDAETITRISPSDAVSNRPADYARAKALWQQQTSRFHTNTKVLANAAMAVALGDPELALQWVKAARGADPVNAEWSRWLAKIYADAIRWSFWHGKSSMIFTGDAEDFRHAPFELPLWMRDSVKKELETSADAALVESVAGAIEREVRLLREKSSSAKQRSLITPELQQFAEFGDMLRGRVRTLRSN